MATKPAHWLTGLLREMGAGTVDGQSFQCPAHDDSRPSLAVGTGSRGQALVHCRAGCPPDDIIDSLHLGWVDLRDVPTSTPAEHADAEGLRRDFPELDRTSVGHPSIRGMHLESIHDYENHVLERWRAPDGSKDMRWFTKTQEGAIPGLMGTSTADLPLYREREVRMAVAAGEPVAVVESESSADALASRGLYATTWAGGADTPNIDRLTGVLAGGQVVVVPDNDESGLRAGRSIWRALNPVADVKHVLPEPGEDARNVLERGGPDAFRLHVPAAAQEEIEVDDWEYAEGLDDQVDDADCA